MPALTLLFNIAIFLELNTLLSIILNSFHNIVFHFLLDIELTLHKAINIKFDLIFNKLLNILLDMIFNLVNTAQKINFIQNSMKYLVQYLITYSIYW